VLPSISRLEAFGIALIEAMACGKPVVASSIPGPGEIVEDGVTGYLVPPKDASGLAKAISLIIQNEDMAKRMGKEGRRRVEDNYTWERVTSRYDRLYNELLV
jgi:glycosyltransferase involved in cell wall biosynthesis